MQPDVSIIFLSYNQAKYLTRALNSVISQTFSDWELLVVDDGSSDASVSIIREFAKNDDRIKCIFGEVNVGAKGSFNRAVLNSRGKFTSLLMADDYWDRDFLEKMISHFTIDPHVSLVSCRTAVISPNANPLYLMPPFEARTVRGDLLYLLENEIFFHFGSIMWRTDYNLRFKESAFGDSSVIFEILHRSNGKFSYFDGIHSYWVRQPNTISTQDSKKLIGGHQIRQLQAWIEAAELNPSYRYSAGLGLLKKLDFLRDHVANSLQLD